MSTEQPASDKPIVRESGAVVHRRETNWQIYLPFLLGILVLLAIFLLMALPSDPVWLDRAQALGDFLYTILCIFPIILCLFPVYLILIVCIYGMRKLHDGVESPLQKLENSAAGIAKKIENFTDNINDKTISAATLFEPLDKLARIFDEKTATEETMADEQSDE